MRRIFVFSSNTEGRHGKGAALYAKTHKGAIQGQAEGLQGDSYAIVTKDLTKPKWLQNRSVSLNYIKEQVDRFLLFAHTNREEMIFDVVAIGCSLAGFYPKEIAPMFKHKGDNVNLPEEFIKVLDI